MQPDTTAAPPAGSPVSSGGYPVHLRGDLDEPLSRWLWLVKWLLALPHYIVLLFLWAAFWVVTVVAGFAILFTGRYPRGLFDFTVGVMRWSWRVQFYTYAALGTDRYPPFTLRSTDYPADLEVAYPERLSRGLVLVKWWLLAIPHYLVLGAMYSGGLVLGGSDNDDGSGATTVPLIGVLVLIAAVAPLVHRPLSAWTVRFRHGRQPLVLPRPRLRHSDA
nr:DUF4389 domain-containing protein [Nocardia huaxiensis]